MALTARQIATTISDYIKRETVQVFRNRKLWAMLNDAGNISFNHEGNDFDWPVRYRQNDLLAYQDGQTLTFPPQNLWVRAVLPYRGYIMTDSVGIKEKLQNKGDAAIVKVIDGIVGRMTKDATDKLGEELYVDGNAAANTNRFHGFESCLGGSAGAAGSKVATNNDTYAGLSTTLAAKGGTWTGTWPSGTGDAEYDYWSPLLVDYSNSGWTGGANTFRTNCIEVLRYGINKAKKNVNKDGAINVVMLTDDMYVDFTNAEDDKTQNRITRDDGSSGLWKLGFRDIMNLDGVDVTYEYGVPAATGYGIPMKMVELRSLQGMLIENKQDWDINSMSDKFLLHIFGNLQFEAIRNFVKWFNYT